MRIAVFLALLLFAYSVHSGEVVVLGRVKEITLLPEGHARCEPRCPADIGQAKEVCISNSCGCGEAKIAVEAVVVGRAPMRTHTAPYRLGEWCMAEFPLDGELVLVRTESGDSQWSTVERTEDGEMWFEAEAFETVAGIAISSLPKSEGRISLSTLRSASDL